MADFNNQRQFDRYELVNKKAKFTQGKKSIENVLLNISRGGVYFIAEEALDSGKRLIFEVQDGFSMKIDVIRSEPIKEHQYARYGKFMVGSGFVGGPISSEKLYEVLEMLLENKTLSHQ